MGENGSVTTRSIGCRSLGKFAGLSHGMTNTCNLPQLQIIINTLTGETIEIPQRVRILEASYC